MRKKFVTYVDRFLEFELILAVVVLFDLDSVELGQR